MQTDTIMRERTATSWRTWQIQKCESAVLVSDTLENSLCRESFQAEIQMAIRFVKNTYIRSAESWHRIIERLQRNKICQVVFCQFEKTAESTHKMPNYWSQEYV